MAKNFSALLVLKGLLLTYSNFWQWRDCDKREHFFEKLEFLKSLDKKLNQIRFRRFKLYGYRMNVKEECDS